MSRSSPNCQEKDDSWKNWPRTLDPNPWHWKILELSYLTAHPGNQFDFGVTFASTLIKLLDDPQKLRLYYERCARKTLNGPSPTPAACLLKCAELADEMGDSDAVESYLNEVLGLGDRYYDPFGVGTPEDDVRKFRIDRGLLSPVDAKDRYERDRAAFTQLLREAKALVKQGSNELAIDRLRLAEDALKNVGDWSERGKITEIFRLYCRINAVGDAQRCLKLSSEVEHYKRLDASFLFSVGEHAHAVAWIEATIKEDFARLDQPICGNVHHAAMSFESRIRELVEHGERARAEQWLSEALNRRENWDLSDRSSSALGTCAISYLATAISRIHGDSAAKKWLSTQGEQGKEARKSFNQSKRAEATDSKLKNQSLDEQLEYAKSSKPKSNRKREVAKVLALFEHWDELHELLNECASPEEAIEIIYYFAMALEELAPFKRRAMEIVASKRRDGIL